MMGGIESFMPYLDLDHIDRRIITELQADGRLSNVELAERVGLSASPCLRRINRLERQGYIASYRAVLGRKRIGLGFTVFLGVKLDSHANAPAEVFEQAVLAMDEVIGCHIVSGESDYILEVVTSDLDAYQKFLLGKLLVMPIIREVRSNIALQSLKADAPLPLEHLSAR